ncbi:MAG: YqgE/AlgH family protein [Desulfobacteraceae bacterium]|jgi:putative transcriptional regulator|nr:YqgE/AlgH family protein [Desulfobacteraceae bacterium]
MAHSLSETFKGQFLIAMPSLLDPNFSHTVICLGVHNDQGAMGVVINRLHADIRLRDVFAELKLGCQDEIADVPLYIGGPVHTNEIFILHGPPLKWQGSFNINPQLALSNSIDLLAAIGEGNGPKNFIVTLGCAGWGPGQLEAEIRQNAWLTCPVSEDILFQVPVSHRWERAVKGLGIDPALLSTTAGNA